LKKILHIVPYFGARVNSSASFFTHFITFPTKATDGYTTHTCKNCAYVLIDTYTPASNAADLKKEWGSERWEKN
jgi:hypothetical protein